MPELDLLRHSPAERARTGEKQHSEPALDEAELKPLVCRQCRSVVSDEGALFAKDAETATRLFSNPAGLLREIFTARAAENLVCAGPPTDEFTWFPGYAWEVATCAACRQHLGWRFIARGGNQPPEFWGLLTAEVIPE